MKKIKKNKPILKLDLYIPKHGWAHILISGFPTQKSAKKFGEFFSSKIRKKQNN